jgi:CheY-like chemotaxis protein
MALDHRRLHMELQERDRRKDEFLAMLSHELRNPLGAITTAVRVLETPGLTEPAPARARAVIARQTSNLARMVDDLLEVSRVTAGRITVTRMPMDLRDAVDRAVEALRASSRLDQHQVTVQGGGVRVQADPARMEQVVTNLLVNAVKYTDPGGKIDVEVAGEDGQAVVRVTDNGIGISPELMPLLFDVFVQGSQSPDRASGGLGIGLTLVRKLVELQGGTIDASSPGQGRGSTFTVRLPQLAGHADDEPELADPVEVPPLRVLLVEDNADARDMLREVLMRGGHEVHEAASGPQAVEKALRSPPHVALVDIGLPGFDGLEVARRLRDDPRTRGVVLVALTGYGQDEDRRKTAENGFDVHLVKPVGAEALDRVLALAARRPRESARLEIG